MIVRLPWDFGTVVYLRVQNEPRKGMVTGYVVHGGGGFSVLVSWGDGSETRHYALELTTEYLPDYSEAILG